MVRLLGLRSARRSESVLSSGYSVARGQGGSAATVDGGRRPEQVSIATPSRPVLAGRSAGCMRDGPSFGDAYARWREEVFSTDLYEISAIKAGFHFGWDAVVMPGASLTRFDAVGMDYARDEARIRGDGYEDVRVQLTHEGGFTGRVGDQDVVVGPGTAVFVDQTLPFFNRSSDTRGVTLALPRSAFGGADVRALHGRVVSGAAFARLDAFLNLQRGALTDAAPSALDRVLTAMGAVVRGAFDTAAEAELQDSGVLDDTVVARLRALAVDPSASAGRRSDELARAVGVSRSALYRAAAPFGGVMEVAWAARLDAAHAAILEAGRPRTLSDLAATLGFHDAAHLQRRFRARFGFKPGDLRPIRA